ncbi:hypothetical protein ISF_00443 [Cordyceps fumosorosea ARSEF 2679]|uniref:Uncharacterized protein n=1 Tax=Cordyceps fumosorosea (strain ARSEF 2679) TaxID=1081104 RepID=A0A162JTG7_CORFA|nr:hypothetical protein ISF_00443 [Cordyceps fumosorosea ARSEF 2679]OAA73542.1 hypothetical protein ISF_00443 [Cordyceps fumosorosea ARSEF 2679]
MKASSAILVLFSGLAVASPLINTRENIDDAKAALGDLQDFVEKSKASTEESLKDQADRQAVWTGRVNQEQALIKQLVDLHKESVQAAADAPARLEA